MILKNTKILNRILALSLCFGLVSSNTSYSENRNALKIASDSNAEYNIASESNSKYVEVCEECGGTEDTGHKLDCIYNKSTFSLSRSTDIEKFDALENDNVNIHLFNYGAAINNPNIADGENGFIPFMQSHTYTENHYNVMDGSNSYSGTTKVPLVSTILIDGYPYIYQDGEPSNYELRHREGSLKYLFDKDSDFVQGNGTYTSYKEPSEIPYGEAASYQSKHFALKEGNSGIFRLKDGNYWYDSMYSAAYYNSDNEQFELYNAIVGPVYTPQKQTATTATGNFFPFNEITDSSSTLWEEFDNHMIWDGEEVPYYILDGDDLDSRTDLWFGMSVEFDFYQPENGVKESGDDMEFNFSGDDDVWVYIDDALVLNIGGTHGAKPGYINFSTGLVEYSNSIGDYTTDLHTLFTNAYDFNTKDTPTSNKIKSILDDMEQDGSDYRFKDFSKHTLKMFYLERGGHTSNCMMEFNMEPLPEGLVSVSKQEENINYAVKGDEEYKFKITKNSGEIIDDALFEIIDTNNYGISTENIETSQSGVYSCTDDGEFWLKDGQTAKFTQGIVINDVVEVEELSNSSDYSTSYSLYEDKLQTLSGNGNIIDNILIENYSTEHEIVFKNTYYVRDLIINKLVSEFPTQEFKFELVNNLGDTLIVLTMRPEDFIYDTDLGEFRCTLNIKGIDIGNYTIKETDVWSWKYYINDEYKDIIELDYTDENWEVTFKNDRKDINWVTEDYSIRNIFN